MRKIIHNLFWVNREKKLEQTSKSAFTLAEVLITLAIVGVVAALTLPTLITTIMKSANEVKMSVIEKRLLQGFNQLNTMEDGFNASQYSKTKDFVEKLSKYYKISTICDSEDLKSCMSSQIINYKDTSGKEKTLNLSDITSSSDLGLNSRQGWLAPASFVSSQGTSFMMLINKNCIMSTEEAMKDFPTSCVSFIYDVNGPNLPNKIGVDIQKFGAMNLGFVLDNSLGVKIISNAFRPLTLTSYKDENGEFMTCDKALAITYAGADTTKVQKCRLDGDNDYWLGAMYKCYSEGGHLPTQDQLATIANNLYKGINAKGNDVVNDWKVGAMNTTIPPQLSGIGSSWNRLWSSKENRSNPTDFANDRIFKSGSTTNYVDGRFQSSIKAICVVD